MRDPVAHHLLEKDAFWGLAAKAVGAGVKALGSATKAVGGLLGGAAKGAVKHAPEFGRGAIGMARGTGSRAAHMAGQVATAAPAVATMAAGSFAPMSNPQATQPQFNPMGGMMRFGSATVLHPAVDAAALRVLGH